MRLAASGFEGLACAGDVRLAEPIRASARYSNPGDLCVILCLFNMGRSPQKIRNFAICHELLRASSIPVVLVECAFGDDPWILDAGPRVVRMRTSSALWQKETLINRGLSLVPAGCTKVAWIDADVLFQNSDWAVIASERLDRLAVVQLAETMVRLPRGASEYDGAGQAWESFGSVYQDHPNALLAGNFAYHGHTGFGWAARRSVLDHAGLYTGCIAGGGDDVMAHAFCGDWESPCIARVMGLGTAWHRHAVAWAMKMYPLVRARLGVVEGAALHLWHGDASSRQYVPRHTALREAGFDPDRDVELDEGGCWRWASNKPAMHAALDAYLVRRRGEGESSVGEVAGDGEKSELPGLELAATERRSCLNFAKT
jgi:hypothetical protein